MPFLGNCTASWRLLFFWFMALDMTNVLGFRYSPFATSFTIGTGMWHGHTPRLIHWTASPLVDHLHPKRFWFTIHGRRNITSLTRIVLIPIDCLPWFIHHSLTMVVSSAHYTGMPILSWRKCIHRARASNALTLPHNCSLRVRSWISLFTLIPPDWICT
jgi:hypothetical protein